MTGRTLPVPTLLLRSPLVVCLLAIASPAWSLPEPATENLQLGEAAAARYLEPTIETLADLVSFRTFKLEQPADGELEEYVKIRRYLAERAAELGFDVEDHGLVVVVGLGDSKDRLGLVTHGDVQPVDASQWAKDPFTLDAETEPGRLIGRGTEDDKGAIAVALYAMKAVADSGRPMQRRIELIVSLSEELDWNPFRNYLVDHPPPPLNVVFDSSYPVTVAEKAWGGVDVFFPLWGDGLGLEEPWLSHLEAGTGLSIVPSRASATVDRATEAIEKELGTAIAAYGGGLVTLQRTGDQLQISASGTGAHSSVPEEGDNALTRLATVLATVDWPPSAAAGVVRLIDDLVGRGNYAGRFGDLAYQDEFMGRLTLTAARVRSKDWKLELGISFRRPSGRSREAVMAATLDALSAWQREQDPGRGFAELEVSVSDPIDQRDAPHVATLLSVYRHYTGQADAQPVAIGGSTHAKLLPGAVNFGPSMPNTPYTGHSEHEFVTRDQVELNLKMMTAALLELATETP